MSIRFFTCKNCNSPASEYNEIYCESCESQLCSCSIPDELKSFINIWEDLWDYVEIDGYDNITYKSDGEDKEKTDIIKKYITYDFNKYGLELKKEFCPICNKKTKNNN